MKNVYTNLKTRIKKLNISNLNILNKSKENQNKINKSNKIIQTTRNQVKKINRIFNGNETSLNKLNTIDANERCNTSRINVKLRNTKSRQRNLNRITFNNKLNNISGSSLLNNINEKQIKTTIFISDKNNNNNNNNNNINSLSKLGIDTMSKENNNLYINKKRNLKEESSVVVYRKKSPLQIRDLSDSPRQKFLKEKTRKNRIPWKTKKKGIDDELDPINIFDRYIKKFKLNKSNPFNAKNYLKQKDINNQRIKINKNKLFNKKGKNIINQNLYKKNVLNTNTFSKNYNNSYIISEKSLNHTNKINNINSTHKKYFININDKIMNSYKDKKIEKNIKFLDLNLPQKTNGKIYTKYNNQSYLTLNNYNNNKFGKHLFENPVENRNINIFINEYKF